MKHINTSTHETLKIYELFHGTDCHVMLFDWHRLVVQCNGGGELSGINWLECAGRQRRTGQESSGTTTKIIVLSPTQVYNTEA